jgi:hypothetical protein
MTRQEELVWAAAWALSLQRTQGRMQPEEQHRYACGDAAEAVFGMQEYAANERIRASMEDGDTMLRQMAGEPECFIMRCSPPKEGVYIHLMCERPQIEAADHCHRCAVFGGWPEADPPDGTEGW